MAKSKEIQRFVAVFDLHFGWEYREERGKRFVSPTHDLVAVRAMMQFVKEFKPNIFILGGDQLNCGPVSHWLHGKPRKLENFRLKDDLALLEEHILVPIEKLSVGRKIWHLGNHEAWLSQLLDETPGLEGMLEPEIWLNLEERGYEIYSQGEISKVGKLNFVHGDILKGSNPARKLVERYRRNIRCGDKHRYEVHTDITAYDRSDFHTGVVVPAMARVNQAYMKNGPSNHQQGFLYGWVAPDGSFTDHVMTIVKGKFLWNGKIYGI